MTNRLERLALHPHPVRRIATEILKRSRLGSYAWRLRFGAVERPFYGYIVYQAAHLASRLGYLRDTAGDFFTRYHPAPIAAIAYDLDFYSSTVTALAMLEAGEQHYLPRVFCYFDDILSSDTELHSRYVGERLAIAEFNEAHRDIKIDSAYRLLARPLVEPWYHQIRICHFLRHSRYNDFVAEPQP